MAWMKIQSQQVSSSFLSFSPGSLVASWCSLQLHQADQEVLKAPNQYKKERFYTWINRLDMRSHIINAYQRIKKKRKTLEVWGRRALSSEERAFIWILLFFSIVLRSTDLDWLVFERLWSILFFLVLKCFAHTMKLNINHTYIKKEVMVGLSGILVLLMIISLCY